MRKRLQIFCLLLLPCLTLVGLLGRPLRRGLLPQGISRAPERQKMAFRCFFGHAIDISCCPCYTSFNN